MGTSELDARMLTLAPDVHIKRQQYLHRHLVIDQPPRGEMSFNTTPTIITIRATYALSDEKLHVLSQQIEPY